MFNSILGLFSEDLAIDLGTANTLVFVRGKGIMIREPSVVARRKKTKEIIALGEEAKQMLGKTPILLEAFRPLKGGVIADFDATEAMLSQYIKKVHEQPGRFFLKIPKPRVVLGIPSGITEVERRAVQGAALAAGARQAYLIEEPIAGALGAKLPIDSSKGSMVIDIGGGTTEIAVLALGGIVLNRSIRIAGDNLDEAIISFLRLKHALLIGQQTAEQVKIDIGSAHPGKASRRSEKGERYSVVRGRDLETGLPKTIRLTESEIREALLPVIQLIINVIQEVIEETPPELLPDILERGIALTGGGALLTNMHEAIAEKIRIPVWVVDDPLTSVVRGCGLLLEQEAVLHKLMVRGGLRT